MAALCTCASTDLRYYLNGVYVEATSTETRLTSTDGRILSTQRFTSDNLVDGVVRILVPFNVLNKIKKHKTVPMVEMGNEHGGWEIIDQDIRIGFTPTDGYFPDILKVIPKILNGEPGQFDPRLFANFAKAAIILGALNKKIPAVFVSHNGKGAAVISLGEEIEYLGIIMPLAKTYPLSAPPSWAIKKLQEKI